MKILNPDFTEQSPKSLPNLEKSKVKSYDDDILNHPVLKQNSNPTSHYLSVYQNIPLDNHHPNLQLPLKPESHKYSTHSNKILTEFCHNKKEAAKGIDKTLAVDNKTSNSVEPIDQFIDYLVEGKETVISVNEDQSISIVNALQ